MSGRVTDRCGKLTESQGEQERIRWEFTPGCRVSCRISALRIILRVKRKRSEVIPAPVIDYSDLSESFCSIRLRRFRS